MNKKLRENDRITVQILPNPEVIMVPYRFTTDEAIENGKSLVRLTRDKVTLTNRLNSIKKEYDSKLATLDTEISRYQEMVESGEELRPMEVKVEFDEDRIDTEPFRQEDYQRGPSSMKQSAINIPTEQGEKIIQSLDSVMNYIDLVINLVFEKHMRQREKASQTLVNQKEEG
jgi:hypothetical protein